MAQQKLTLAICMYNASPYIEVTLQSVLAQSMQDFHLLIVDDCSTDDSVEKVEAFFAKNPRQYELVRLEQNQGIGHARYYAETHATTRYMLFVDADDILHPMLVEKEYQAIVSDADLIGVSCWLEFISENGKSLPGGHYLGVPEKEQFLNRAKRNKLVFLPICTMYNREAALRTGGFSIDGYPDGFPRYRDFCEDLEHWTRMSDLYVEGKAIITLPETLYWYRKRGGLSSNSFNMIIKMRYVKQNLLRRRAGEGELSFIEFMDSLSDKELAALKRDAAAADALRNAHYYWKKRQLLKVAVEVLKSVWYRPGYIIDKLKHNSGINK